MVKINLSGIHFRPYAEGDEPTEYGPDDYVSPGSGIILSRLKFRPYEDPILTSLGGSGGSGGGGSGGGGEGEDPGGYELGDFAYSAEDTADTYAYYDFSPLTEIYARVAIYVSSAAKASFIAGGDLFTGDFLSMSSDNDPSLFSWEGVFFTKNNQAGVADGEMYVWSYYSAAADKILVTTDEWHVAEIGIRENGVNVESTFRWDGVEAPWQIVGLITDLNGGITTILVGNNFSASYGWYLDNAMLSFNDWISEGGLVAFEDGFETGDFSGWTGVVGTPSVGGQP